MRRRIFQAGTRASNTKAVWEDLPKAKINTTKKARERMPGGQYRDSAYQRAGSWGKKGAALPAGSHEQRVLGRRRIGMYGGGALGVYGFNKARGSSGRNGVQPHSMGGTTGY